MGAGKDGRACARRVEQTPDDFTGSGGMGSPPRRVVRQP